METIFMTFIVYAFVGWIWESIFCSIKDRHFVYRGFLLGPYCPVYGFGVTAVLLLVPENAGTLLNLYFNVVVIVTIIEYITSWLLEKVFNMKLWDYTNVPLNIGGRVAVSVSLFWGIGCLILIKIINPFFQTYIQLFINNTKGIGPIILAILFLADVVTTFTFTMTTKKEVEANIDESDTENAAIKEYRLKHLFENRKSSKGRTRILQRLSQRPKNLRLHNLNRIVKNYPNLTFKKMKRNEK
ncbi:putative ABC transporter permease [Enterococcus sp. HY326]|uniref:putative ABC transporter permease n=1 Tax=Enterococcus sp. HY326 TaxID=2971265 RepID=UPI003A0FEA9A